MALNDWQAMWWGDRRRWLAVGVALTAVLLMGFYAVTNPDYLAHDHVLAAGDWLGAGICHRLTERSFVINGRQFPLCARCTGMYLGVALVFVVLALAGRLRWAELPPLPLLLLLLGFIGIMGVDGINSYAHFFPNAPHLYAPRNWLRLLTGTGTGLAMGLLMLPVLAQTLWQAPWPRRVIASWREMGWLLLLAATAVLLLLSNQPLISYVMAVASILGIVVITTAINAVLLLTIFRLDGRAARWRETAVSLGICLLLAVIELSAISLARLELTGTITGLPGL